MTPQEIAKHLTDAPQEFLEKAMPLLQEVIGLVQLATAGDAKKVEDLVNKPGNFMQKLLSVDQSALMGFIEAKGLWYLLQPVDPGLKITHKDKIEWAKLITDIVKYSETKRITKESWGSQPGPATRKVAEYENELIQEVVGNGEESGQKGSGQGGN